MIWFSACTYRPRGVLSERRMREVLIDLHKAEGTLQIKGLANNDRQVALYYQAVLQKHGITQAQFDSSLVWYTDNPNIFDKIYPNVVKQIESEYNVALASTRTEKERRELLKVAAHHIDSIVNSAYQKPIIQDFYQPADTTPDYGTLPLVYSPHYLDSLSLINK